MAYLLSSERPVAAATSASFLSGFYGWVVSLRKTRAQRVALVNLLELDDTRLADLGIERSDIHAAIRNPQRSAGALLSARRATSAKAWLNS